MFIDGRALLRLRPKRRKTAWLEPTMPLQQMVNGMRAAMPVVRTITRTTTVTFAKSLAIVAVVLASDVAIPIVVDGEAENLGKMTATPVKTELVRNGRVQTLVHVVVHQVHSVAVAAAAEAVAMEGKCTIYVSILPTNANVNTSSSQPL